MKSLLLIIASCVALAPFTQLSASSSSSSSTSSIGGIQLAQAPIIAKEDRINIILQNNTTYKPRKKFAKIAERWQPGDVVRVLTTENEHTLLLVNLTKNNSIKAKVDHIK